MPFLTLNGITCPVDTDGGGAELEQQADSGRGTDGSFLASVYSTKRRWKIGTKRMAAREANAWMRLAMGFGHRFSCVDLFTSKGLLAVGTGSVTPNGASGKFDKRVTLTSTSTLSWTFGLDRFEGLVGDYTISVWHEDTGPVWNHYLIVRLGATINWWLNGADQGAATLGAGALAWVAVDLALGKLTFTATGGVSHAWSELVWHPFAIGKTTGEWVTSFSGATVAHPDLPSLRAAGTLVAFNLLPSPAVQAVDVETVPGSVSHKPAPANFGSGWDVGGAEVDFELAEL